MATARELEDIIAVGVGGGLACRNGVGGEDRDASFRILHISARSRRY